MRAGPLSPASPPCRRPGPRAAQTWALCVALGFGALFGSGLGALGCGGAEAEPVSVARTFAATARRGDVGGMLAVLERGAVDRLELAAERASDQVGGRRGIDAAEMLQIVGVDRTVAVAEATLLEQDERRARVELTMTDGHELQLDLVWQEPLPASEENPARAGGWKVRIPLPESTPAPEPAPAPDA